jgi:hypothetical protein
MSKAWDKYLNDPALQKSVAMAREMLNTPMDEEDLEGSHEIIDSEFVVELTGKLMDVEDAIEQCKDCRPGGNWCWEHLERHADLNRQLREAMGRPFGGKNA